MCVCVWWRGNKPKKPQVYFPTKFLLPLGGLRKNLSLKNGAPPLLLSAVTVSLSWEGDEVMRLSLLSVFEQSVVGSPLDGFQWSPDVLRLVQPPRLEFTGQPPANGIIRPRDAILS